MKTNGISDHARKLHSALVQRGVDAEIEKWDGHKHIDLSVQSARLYIEIDGIHHYIDASTILRDLERDYFSTEDDFDTIHIPNQVLDSHLNEVADALAEVVKTRTE
jgi:very-short-patch-repair endonuclease